MNSANVVSISALHISGDGTLDHGSNIPDDNNEKGLRIINLINIWII